MIGDKFLAFKTPLSSQFDGQVPVECRFNPSMLVSSLKQYKVGAGSGGLGWARAGARGAGDGCVVSGLVWEQAAVLVPITALFVVFRCTVRSGCYTSASILFKVVCTGSRADLDGSFERSQSIMIFIFVI